MFRDSSSVHHQGFSLYTQQCYMSYSLRAGSGRNQFHPDPARKLSANLYEIYHCCVYSEKLLMMDRGTVPEHVEFYSKKFGKLMHIFRCV